jgi:hypothetical protein
MTGIAFIPLCQALVKRKMMYFKRKLQQEDAPANSAGSGAIAGIGVGPQGEPGISRSVMKKYKKRNDSGKEAQETELSLMKRKTPMMEETKECKTGTFAGQTTFVVPSNIFHEARMSKKKGKHWRTYIGEDDHWKHIREYAMKNPKKAVILQDENTGSMCYARYGSK